MNIQELSSQLAQLTEAVHAFMKKEGNGKAPDVQGNLFPTELQRCPKCGKDLPREAFSISQWGNKGCYCRSCMVIYNKEKRDRGDIPKYTKYIPCIKITYKRKRNCYELYYGADYLCKFGTHGQAVRMKAVLDDKFIPKPKTETTNESK